MTEVAYVPGKYVCVGRCSTLPYTAPLGFGYLYAFLRAKVLHGRTGQVEMYAIL